MKKFLQIGNGVALVSTIFINYLSNTGAINNTTIGDRSNDINSLFTPAGYAFSIWGVIYLLLFGFVIFQGRSLFNKNKEDDFVEKVGIWFIVSCVANCAWVFLWLYGLTGLSCIAMFVMLFSLIQIIIRNKMEIVAHKHANGARLEPGRSRCRLQRSLPICRELGDCLNGLDDLRHARRMLSANEDGEA